MSNCPSVQNNNKPNDYYGLTNTGDIGSSFRERSFGGASSNRKYTKQQVMPHKLQDKEIIKGEVTLKLNDENPERYMPPLIPRILGNTENPEYRSGYMTNENHVEIPKNNNYNQYFFPMQHLQKMTFKQNENKENENEENNNYEYNEIVNTVNGIPISEMVDISVSGDYVKYPYYEGFENIENKTDFYNSTLKIRDCINKNNNNSNNYEGFENIENKTDFYNSTLKIRECIEKNNNNIEMIKENFKITKNNFLMSDIFTVILIILIIICISK